MELWTALIIGFFGSFHCVGMCGPIAMAIPRQSSALLPLTFNAVLYNSGRILTYSLLGTFFGVVGVGFTVGGFQGVLSILLGIIIIAGVFFSRFFKKSGSSLFPRFNSWVTRAYGRLMRKESKPALFGMGFLNGLLPCPFVYSALAAAVLTESAVYSAGYMALFGLGTFPAMYLMYLSPNILSKDLRTMIRGFVPYLAITLGVILIVRGLVLYDLFVPAVSERVDAFCIFPGTDMN